LIDRVRGPLFRAAPEHREDFAKADRQFQRSGDRTGFACTENRQALIVGVRRANAELGSTNADYI